MHNEFAPPVMPEAFEDIPDEVPEGDRVESSARRSGHVERVCRKLTLEVGIQMKSAEPNDQSCSTHTCTRSGVTHMLSEQHTIVTVLWVSVCLP